jgi:thioredoxin 1
MHARSETSPGMTIEGHRIQEISEAEFGTTVLASEEPVLVDFSATWCAPCRRLTPILEEIARERAGKLRVVSVDIDTNQAIVTRYGIRAAPTLLLFSGAEVKASRIGFSSKAHLEEMIEEAVR